MGAAVVKVKAKKVETLLQPFLAGKFVGVVGGVFKNAHETATTHEIHCNSVGIGGGAPSRKHDIRLGDIAVSAPRDGKGGVFQYDFGKTIQNQSFRTTGFLNQPPMLLRAAVSDIKAEHEVEGHQLEDAINSVLERKPKLRKHKRPDRGSDRLYQSGHIRPLDDGSGCFATCGEDLSQQILRADETGEDDNPAIHYGLIASANQLMKDALIRDKLAVEKDVLCFEIEVAWLMNQFPCLVIHGICGYLDSHNNKEWQGYAAMTAAAYTKDLLHRIPPNKVEAKKRIGEIYFSDLEYSQRFPKGMTGLHLAAGEGGRCERG